MLIFNKNNVMLYAAYGSNLHPERLRARVRSAALKGIATLAGWELKFHKRGMDGSAKCNIVACPGGRVEVAVYRLDSAQLWRLDRAEGMGRGYQHLKLAAAGFGPVLTYRADEAYIDESLQPFTWYHAYVVAGCEYHGFDPAYVGPLRDHPHIDDPDAARQREHLARIRRFRPGHAGSANRRWLSNGFAGIVAPESDEEATMTKELLSSRQDLVDAKDRFRKAAEKSVKDLVRERERLKARIKRANAQAARTRAQLKAKAERLAKTVKEKAAQELKDQQARLKQTLDATVAEAKTMRENLALARDDLARARRHLARALYIDKVFGLIEKQMAKLKADIVKKAEKKAKKKAASRKKAKRKKTAKKTAVKRAPAKKTSSKKKATSKRKATSKKKATRKKAPARKKAATRKKTAARKKVPARKKAARKATAKKARTRAKAARKKT